MSVTTATQLEPASAVLKSTLSTMKVTSSVSVSTQPKSTKSSKVLDIPKRDHLPKRTVTLKADTSQPAQKKSATVAKPKAAKVTKGSSLSYKTMVSDAIEKLAEKKGSSAAAILKYIANHHAIGDFTTARRFVYKALKRGLERGMFVTSSEKSSLSGRFRVVKKAEKNPKAASGDGVMKAVKTKKMSSAKKTSVQKTAKKSPTPKKTKPSAKSTTVTKKPTAPKSATSAKKKTVTAKTTKSTAFSKPAKKPVSVKSTTKKTVAAK